MAYLTEYYTDVALPPFVRVAAARNHECIREAARTYVRRHLNLLLETPYHPTNAIITLEQYKD